MVVARRHRQEALLAGMLKTIVGFALLSDLDGFEWSSKNHGLESASISSQSRMKAVRLPFCALALTRRPQSALNFARILAALPSSDVGVLRRRTHTNDQQLRWRFRCCTVLRFADRSTSLACRRRRISANDRLSLPITATQ